MLLVIATRNPGKLREFGRLLAAHGCQAVPLSETGFTAELVESGSTYAENALAKAAAVTDATGLPALGDDSGIEVAALGGWPGPASARWMGPQATDEQRLRSLLAEVETRTPDQRRVRYVAALAYVRPEHDPIVVRGTCQGILVEPRGCNGFGYDPSFLSDDLELTFGEADEGSKDRVSHRARALRELANAGAFSTPGMALTGTQWF